MKAASRQLPRPTHRFSVVVQSGLIKLSLDFTWVSDEREFKLKSSVMSWLWVLFGKNRSTSQRKAGEAWRGAQSIQFSALFEATVRSGVNGSPKNAALNKRQRARGPATT